MRQELSHPESAGQNEGIGDPERNKLRRLRLLWQFPQLDVRVLIILLGDLVFRQFLDEIDAMLFEAPLEIEAMLFENPSEIGAIVNNEKGGNWR